ncbi:MAG: reprolysin-like metallopeptidase [Ginsengibacter sp.]
MKKLLLVFLSCTLLNAAMAQQNHWTAHTSVSPTITDKAVSRVSFPAQFKLFDLDAPPLRNELLTVAIKNATTHSTIISLPNADGQIEQFEVFEASNFEPDLQAMFPEIRAFSGRGITDKYATLKLSISPQGLQTMVFRTEKENEFIEPYSKDHNVYAVFKSQRSPNKLPWTCTTPDEKLSNEITASMGTQSVLRSTHDLKVMRLAQSVTAEYSNYFGATSSAQVGLVLAAINATLARCNGVYEKDLAVHLNLIAATTNVIYYNAATDPYSPASTGAGGAWNSQLQTTLTNVIGAANYDIGHLFGASGGGGNAGCIGCICVNASKGSGFTSPADGIPQGDNFDIDYVVHEMGHQMGANHTFSMSNEGTGVNKEVGSGITIMGYAGITSQDVAPHSIDIFHEASIAQIQANLASKTCPVTTVISNSTPVVAALTNYTIPKSTPFALTGSASDADAGDVLTYCWEQNDNATSAQTGANSVASATKTPGPNWLSFRPAISSTRYCPQLSTILAGGLITGPLPGGDAIANIEALSSVARTLNFRLTVRDNAPYSSSSPVSVGQTNFADMVVTVSAASGPFAVTAPNTAVTYAGGSTQNITWSVANTTAAPVSCANVKISLSTDGGQTFPTVLAASTPNDGTEALVIPSTPTTTARIKIESVGNIFFDISNTNFTIGGTVSCGNPTGLTTSSITTSGATVSWTAVSGAVSYAVDYKLNSSSTWTSFSTAQTATSANLTGLASSSLYDWRVSATCSGGSGSQVAAQFTTATPAVCNAPSGLTASSITISSATVSWTAVSGAASYAVDYKLNTSSTWISAATATTSTSVALSGLAAGSLYDYRVSTNCGAIGTSGFTVAQFTTATQAGCGDPSPITASGITTNSATLNWTAVSNAQSYTVLYKLQSASTNTKLTINQPATSVNLTGLTAGSVYDWKIRATCASGTGNIISAQFTTANPGVCNAPSGLNASSITTTGATISWTAVSGAASYDADYKLNTSSTWISAATATTSTSVGISGLAAGSLYDYRVRTNCGANGTSGYSMAQFMTSSNTTCPSPYDVSTNGTISGAATIPFNTDINGLLEVDRDIDFYKFVITNGGTITLTLGTLPADYTLALFNSAGTVITTSQNPGTTSETINYTIAPGTYYARVLGFHGVSDPSNCYTLRVALGTASRQGGVEFANQKLFTIYPNPAKDKLNIYLSGYTGISEVGLYDLSGRSISKLHTSDSNSKMDVSTLAKGVYYLKVVTADGEILNKKVVKQ